MRRVRGDMQWIRAALRASNFPIGGEKGAGIADGPQLALDRWIAAQRAEAGSNGRRDRLETLLEAAQRQLSAMIERHDVKGVREVLREAGREVLVIREEQSITERAILWPWRRR
jgi:hypothetical protein